MSMFQKLKKARKDQKIRLQDLAKEFGIRRETMGGYESGKLDPRLSFVKQWAKRLGCIVEIREDNTF